MLGAPQPTAWGGETNRSSSEAFQPWRFTTYEQDSIGSDDAMHRRYNRWWARFEQPDPYGGSYDLTDPQSFNRYSYVLNDPVNFVDPTGLLPKCEEGREAVDPVTGEIVCVPPVDGGTVTVLPDPDLTTLMFVLTSQFSGIGIGGAQGGIIPRQGRPQNPTPPSPQDDCHRFATLVQGIANNTKNDKEFLDELARTFTSANNSSTNEMRRNSGGPVNPPRISFGDSGFKPQFQDGRNQVRHFVAGFIAGATWGLAGLAFMNDREGPNANAGNNADIRLNGVSTDLGSRFTDRLDATEFRRARLADAIREDVCQ